MIIELGRTIAHSFKRLYHIIFRALFCKDWEWLPHYGAICRKVSCPYTYITYCTYKNCPKRKGADDENVDVL